MNFTDVARFADLQRMGIVFDHATVRDMVAGMTAAGMITQDAVPQGLITTPSVITPLQFLQQWLPGFVSIITTARRIDEILGITTVGSWEDEEVVQGTMEPTASPALYGDQTNVPLASWNANFERRSVVRFEQGMRVGRLAEARAARIRMDDAGSKRTASSVSLETRRNQVGFIGYNGGAQRTYGFLNDPTLPNYINFPNGASASPHWSTKTFIEITADIRTMFSTLRTQSGDNIDPKATATTLVLGTAVVDYMSVTPVYGSGSVASWLAETYPRCRVVSAPELDAANGGANVAYLFADEVMDSASTDDRKTFIQIVPAKFMVLGVAKTAKGYEEDYSNATAGVLLKRAWAVVRFSGN